MPVSGQPLDEAARALARKVAVRLAASEGVRVSGRNLTSLPSSEMTKAQTAFSRGLRRGGQTIVEITLTISEGARGHLLVAEVKRGSERIVEMTAFEPAPVRPV